MIDQDLIRKYDVPGPRYTSYPTVPYWDPDGFSREAWESTVRHSFEESNATQGTSLYIHLPFCESLCTFCGCTKRITRKHAVESPYIDTLLAEWRGVRELYTAAPRIKELHLGGGTPTFFAPANLRRLIEGLTAEASLTQEHEFGFEAHPNSTTTEHLETLYALGFRRLSLGVQDFDPGVQLLINRIQPFERVREVTAAAREAGYGSINFDLVYGLPGQTERCIVDTISKVGMLRPDRIAFYSYAHVPWIRGIGQRKFSESDLPGGAEKRRLYELGRSLLEQAGYLEIGMDHFALPGDALLASMHQGRLHRNFMGYTSAHSLLTIGLGMSAISDSWYGFAQNEKKLEDYARRIADAGSATFRGHILSGEDRLLRRHILNLMCRLETRWNKNEASHPIIGECVERLGEMADDGLVSMDEGGLTVTEAGLPFVRNVCMAFDVRMWRNQPEAQLFSQTI